jgi:hypothetical protein
VALDHLYEGCEAPGMGYSLRVWTVRVPGGPDLLLMTLPLSGELIQCQSHHDNYACLHGEVDAPSDDGMDPSTRVPAVWRLWACIGVHGWVQGLGLVCRV